ncbi:MAG: AMP-binding protein [Saprospiraceae bacterium]|nr:AMP-binding protein [Saprospiraceae bacterium]MCF8248723.1 AMP-binding protein [Saprospiraceae bacterium]MCF8278787.1 AMP-binding protein [Bacteroidales bacterium]MCF8310587.1 AMP-binding protein [Saprospiraceae bacterium]MCF8439146.1 AMP-binding protein [Saprospiraceae bacterium]
MKLTADTTLLEHFYRWERTTPQKVFLKQPFGNEWRDYSWQEAGEQARRLAAYLLSLDLPPHSHIGLVSKNCAEWFISDLAIMMSGHVSVPFFPTLTGEQLHFVMKHSGCKVLLVGKLDDWASMKPGVPKDVLCIAFPNYNPDPDHVQWADIMDSQPPLSTSPIPKLDDLMTVIYTSGTTGNPKGVMLSFGNMAAMLYSSREHLCLDVPDPRVISYLPLCHIAERGVLVNVVYAVGVTVFFAERLDTFAKNLVATRPTHFGGVPRIYAKFQQGVLSKMPQRRLDFLLKIPVINNLIRRKIIKTLGLDAVQVFLVAAAPMPVSLLEWYERLGIVIQEAYGMTENTAIVTVTPRQDVRPGKVGKATPGVQIKLLPGTGEICTKSAANTIGYYNEPEMTAATIDSFGWLHSGDVGELDADGYLKITGRVKEMYKTSKGEYVAPAQIEMGFAVDVFIEQICVMGEGLPQPVGLVVLSELAASSSREAIAAHLTETLDTLNPKLKSYERVQKLVVVKEPWTVENNLMTPSLKIRRMQVEKAFAKQVHDWYGAAGKVIWEVER